MNERAHRPDGRIAWMLLCQSTLRHWCEAKWSYLLIPGIAAIGVGSLNGIRQASRAATANFGLFNEAVSGRSEFLIEALVGPLNASQLFELSETARSLDWHLLPVVEGPLTQLDGSGEPLRQLRLVGLDLVAVANLPNFIEQGFSVGTQQGEWHSWVGPSTDLWVSAGFLDDAGLALGEVFEASVAGEVHRLTVAGILGDAHSGLPEDLVIADLPSVQQLLSRAAEIDRVEVLVNNRRVASDPQALANLEQRWRTELPEGMVLREAAERAADRAGMTAAFRLNLMILSLIAMLVGAYLILQALDAAVVRRRNEIATLKSLGVSARAILVCLLFEASLIGLLGSAAGMWWALLAVEQSTVSGYRQYPVLCHPVASIQLNTSDIVWEREWLSFQPAGGPMPARDAMATPPAQILHGGIGRLVLVGCVRRALACWQFLPVYSAFGFLHLFWKVVRACLLAASVRQACGSLVARCSPGN